MHKDSHIETHNRSLNIFVKTELVGAQPSAQNYVIEPDAPDFKAAWSGTLTQAFAKSDATDVYILVSSHGGPGLVMFNDEEIGLDFMMEDLAKLVKDSEQRGVPRRINFVYSACYSGSIFPIIDVAWKKFSTQSPISVISSAPANQLSHSSVLISYFYRALELIYLLNKEKRDYCKGCSRFERLGRLIAAAQSVPHKDVPTFWSSNFRAINLTLADFTTELKLFAPLAPRILATPEKIYQVFETQRTDGLLKFFYNYKPGFFFNHMSELMQIQELLEKNVGASELAEKLIELFPKESVQFSSTTLNETAAGFIAGWILMDRKVHDRSEFYKTLIRNWDSDKEAPHVIAAIQAIKISTLISRKNLDGAIDEFIKLSRIPIGWQHSASPFHSFIEQAIESIFEFAASRESADLNRPQRWIKRILQDESAGRKFIRWLAHSRDALSKLKNNDEVIKFILKHRIFYELPSGFDKIKFLQIFAEIKDNSSLLPGEAKNYWIDRFKKNFLLFDGEIEAGNKYLGLDLPYLLGERRGVIPFPSIKTCREILP